MKHLRIFALCAALAGLAAALSGCIPSAPEPEKAAAPAASPAPAEGKPPVTTHTVVEEGKAHSELAVNPDTRPNASIEVSPLPDGKGYSLRGTFNLSGTITPAGPGKWLLKAEYRVAEADFSAGTPMITALGEVGPGAGGDVAVTQNPQMVLVDLPVSPPSAPAPEGAALRRVPVEAEIAAPDHAAFNVFFTTMPR